MFDPNVEEQSGEEDSDDPAVLSSHEVPPVRGTDAPRNGGRTKSPATEAAEKELQAHELLALFTCFAGPAFGAWLLHAIRSSLSRPSEGLVSNYNLTVFLLAAEIRPMAHLIKLMQARTLYLQKIVVSDNRSGELKLGSTELLDLTHRLEELESHVVESAVKAEQQAVQESSEAQAAAAELTSDVRKNMQSELDALNRAMRRYEKRTTVAAVQTEARLQEVEARLQDALVLAAAAQRSAQGQPHSFLLTLINWASAAVVVPLQGLWSAMHFPIRAATYVLSFTRGARPSTRRDRYGGGMSKDGKRIRSSGTSSQRAMQREREREKLGRA